jgi:hypothetical protein
MALFNRHFHLVKNGCISWAGELELLAMSWALSWRFAV